MADDAGTDEILNPAPVLQMAQGMHFSSILRTGVQLGVFDQIAAGNTDAATIAANVGGDSRATRILLNALVALRLLDGETDGQSYRLSRLAEAFLVTSSPTYFGGTVEIFAGDWAWKSFPVLTETIRKGGTALRDVDAELPGWDFWEIFADSSHGIARPAGEAIAQMMDPWAAGREQVNVLDVAAGSGYFGCSFAKQYEQAHVTLLDWPNILEHTRRTVEELHLEDRASYIAGNVFEVPLGGPYDLIIVSHLFHHFSQARCVELLRRFADVLAPDGRLVIHDFIGTEPNSADDPFPALFSIIMLTMTHEGEAYSLATYQDMLHQAGFEAPEMQASQAMPSRLLVTGLPG